MVLIASQCLAYLAMPVEAAEQLVDGPPSRSLALPPTDSEVVLPGIGPEDLRGLPRSGRGLAGIGVSRAFPSDSVARSLDPDGPTWTFSAAGPVWRLRVRSRHAVGLRVHFKEFSIGEGRLWVHSDAGRAFGPYSGSGPFGDGDFWSPIISGDFLVIEYWPSTQPTPNMAPPFRIAEIGHLWDVVSASTGPGSFPEERSVQSAGGSIAPMASSIVPRRPRWASATAPPQVGRRNLSALPTGFWLPATKGPTVFVGGYSYKFEVFDSDESIDVSLLPSHTSSRVSLYMRFGRDIVVVDGEVLADHHIEAGRNGLLTVSRRSAPPLQTGTYFVALASETKAPEDVGSISVSPARATESCYTDAACHETEWGLLTAGVALVEFAGDDGNHYRCSGSLLNDRSGSKTPYFLTAAHCIASSHSARSVVAKWFFQNAACGAAHTNNRDHRYAETHGAELLASETGSVRGNGGIDAYGDGDISLLRLAGQVPQGVTYLGWNPQADAIGYGTNVVGVHHAESLHKQIAFGKIQLQYPHMIDVRWGHGLTLGGASGSPVMNEEGQVLGVLSGGRDDSEGCFDSGSPAVYSSFRSFFPSIERFLEGHPSPTAPPTEEIERVLESDVPDRFSLDLGTAGRLQNGSGSYRVWVPSDATSLEIALQSDDSEVDIDLYVRHGSDMLAPEDAHWSAESHSGNERIVIGSGSQPALQPGLYYIALLRFDDRSSAAATGTITASIGRGPPAASTAVVGGRLQLGVPSRFSLDRTSTGILQNGSRAFVVNVPSDTVRLILTLHSTTPGEDVDMYVRHGAPPDQLSDAHWFSAGYAGDEELTIGVNSNPPLVAGDYYISLLRFGAVAPTSEGTLEASAIGGGGPVPGMEFIPVSPGEFVMGQPDAPSYSDEKPLTRVRISKAFEIGKHEVTQMQWESVMGDNPSSSSAESCGENCPVDNVSWTRVQEFIAKLNSLDSEYTYRFPTEAEWEYAARAGTIGDQYGPLESIAWTDYRTHVVGLKQPNRFGLHDTLGNVDEWVQDWFGNYPGGKVTDPRGPQSGAYRVARGGNFCSLGPEYCRVSDRINFKSPDSGVPQLGFRLARRSGKTSEPPAPTPTEPTATRCTVGLNLKPGQFCTTTFSAAEGRFELFKGGRACVSTRFGSSCVTYSGSTSATLIFSDLTVVRNSDGTWTITKVP